MDLVLWRHCEAVPEGRGDDLARALTDKGERQAERMAEWLNERLDPHTRVIVSPAVRCQQTARALGRKFETVDTLAPGASGQRVLMAAGWPESTEAVLVVGHQPTLGWAAALALTGTVQSLSVKKGAAWWIRHRDRAGGGQAMLHMMQAPDGL